jgi:hypothetical protein
MKPSMNPKTLQVALVLVAAIVVGVAEAPGLAELVSPTVLHWVQLLATVIGSSQLIKRIGDYAPSEVTLVPAERVSTP